MVEVRFHGRFGQPVGKVTRTIANQLMAEGKHVQVFDSFAAFRPGNPTFSTLRVSDEVIIDRSSNDPTPDAVVVLDNSLFGVADVTKGLKRGGTVMALRVGSEVLGEKTGDVKFIPLDTGFQREGNEKGKDKVDSVQVILKVLKENDVIQKV